MENFKKKTTVDTYSAFEPCHTENILAYIEKSPPKRTYSVIAQDIAVFFLSRKKDYVVEI